MPLWVAPGDLLASPQASPRLLEAAPPPLPARVVAGGGQGAPCQPRRGPRHPVSLPRNTDPYTMDKHHAGTGIARRHGLVESRMRGDTHVRFGGAGRGTRSSERAIPRPGPTPTRPALRAAAVTQANPCDTAISRFTTAAASQMPGIAPTNACRLALAWKDSSSDLQAGCRNWLGGDNRSYDLH